MSTAFGGILSVEGVTQALCKIVPVRMVRDRLLSVLVVFSMRESQQGKALVVLVWESSWRAHWDSADLRTQNGISTKLDKLTLERSDKVPALDEMLHEVHDGGAFEHGVAVGPGHARQVESVELPGEPLVDFDKVGDATVVHVLAWEEGLAEVGDGGVDQRRGVRVPATEAEVEAANAADGVVHDDAGRPTRAHAQGQSLAAQSTVSIMGRGVQLFVVRPVESGFSSNL